MLIASQPQPKVVVLDSRTQHELGTELTLTGGTPLAQAAQQAARALNHLTAATGTKGVDGTDAPLRVYVNDALNAGSAEWYRGAKRFGPVDEPFSRDPQVVMHELAHGMWDHLVGRGLANARVDDPRALEAVAVGEAFADVLGSTYARRWRGVIPGAARDIERGSILGAHPVLTKRWQYDMAKRAPAVIGTRLLEPHAVSGILSHAASKLQRQAGWDGIEELFIGAMRHLGQQSPAEPLRLHDLDDAARALRSTAASIWGARDTRTGALDDALDDAGLH